MENDQLLDKVKRFYFRHKRLPTYREMKRLFDFASPNAVAWTVHKWVEKGIVKLEDRKLSPDNQFFALPLLGVIKAGAPTTEQYYETESVSLDEYLVGNPGFTYLLRVSGDSMIGEGINPGDLVVLDKKREPKNGDIVAALVDSEWTLKYLQKEKEQVFLLAANPKYPPIYPKTELNIGGVVVSVIRKYY